MIDNEKLPIVYNVNFGHATPRCALQYGVVAKVDMKQKKMLSIKIIAVVIGFRLVYIKIYIWNDGEMPRNPDSTDKLFMKHSSKPYNPKLANVFFKSGMIEAWGRGFEKIKEACGLYDGSLPEYEINEAGIMVLCKACDRYLELLNNDVQHHDRVGYDEP